MYDLQVLHVHVFVKFFKSILCNFSYFKLARLKLYRERVCLL